MGGRRKPENRNSGGANGKKTAVRDGTAAAKQGGSASKPVAVLAIVSSVLLILAVCALVYCFLFYIRPQREAQQSAQSAGQEAPQPAGTASDVVQEHPSAVLTKPVETDGPGPSEPVAHDVEGEVPSGPQDSQGSRSGDVENHEMTVVVNGEEKECLYSGRLVEGKTVGEGHYEFPDGNGSFWSYDGTCLRNNIWTGTTVNQPVLFGTEEYSYSGRYSGDLLRGIPEGEGKLVISGTQGLDCTYTGGWKNGSYDGYGELIYNNQNIIRYIGNFEGGSFRPTLPQLVSALSSGGGNKTGLEPQVLSFVGEHAEDFRTCNAAAFNFVRYDPNLYRQNIENGKDDCFRCSVMIEQKIDYGTDTFGLQVSEVLATSNNGREVLHGWYLGDASRILEKQLYTLQAYPLRRGTLKDSTGSSLDTTVFLAVDISK